MFKYWRDGEGRGVVVAKRGKGRGSHQNPKPQACVGETMGVQEGVGWGEQGGG